MVYDECLESEGESEYASDLDVFEENDEEEISTELIAGEAVPINGLLRRSLNVMPAIDQE